MKALDSEVVNQFIITTVLIDPISDIIAKIQQGEFRDCDIKWLDSKMEGFIKFAAETLGVKGIMPSDIEMGTFTVLNEYTTTQYLKRFNTLLEYFKSF